MLTGFLLGQDLHGLWEGQWRVKGQPYRGLTPQELWSNTAAQIFAMFFRGTDKRTRSDWKRDKIGLAKLANESRAEKGLQPVIPHHLLQSCRTAEANRPQVKPKKVR